MKRSKFLILAIVFLFSCEKSELPKVNNSGYLDPKVWDIPSCGFSTSVLWITSSGSIMIDSNKVDYEKR